MSGKKIKHSKAIPLEGSYFYSDLEWENFPTSLLKRSFLPFDYCHFFSEDPCANCLFNLVSTYLILYVWLGKDQ